MHDLLADLDPHPRAQACAHPHAARWRMSEALEALLLQALAYTLARARRHDDPPPSIAPRRDAGSRSALSAREREVIACIDAGESNKVIARRLGLSVHTVKRHVANLLAKLDARSRGEAAARWRSDAPRSVDACGDSSAEHRASSPSAVAPASEAR